MGLPLAASDEPNRFGIQLYHRTATQADLSGKQVLKTSCGHGGGASTLCARSVRPPIRGWTSTQTASRFAERGIICPGWISCTAMPKACPLPMNPLTR